MTELNRLMRHGFAPLVAYLVAQGYLPEYMQDDATEFLVILTAIVGPMVWSWARDKRK